MTTISLGDDKGRYWEVDLDVFEGSDDFVYDGNWLPGDEAGYEILGGRVELKSLSGKSKRIVQVGSDKVEMTFSDTDILRRL